MENNKEKQHEAILQDELIGISDENSSNETIEVLEETSKEELTEKEVATNIPWHSDEQVENDLSPITKVRQEFLGKYKDKKIEEEVEPIEFDKVVQASDPRFVFCSNDYIVQEAIKADVEIKIQKFQRTKLFFLSAPGVAGAFFLFFLIICALIIPFTSQSPYEIDSESAFLDFGVNGHILGTDFLGRDIWARTFWGLRNSLLIALAATTIDLFVGIVLGLLMGYFRVFDKILLFVIKVLNSIPNVIILIIITLVLDASVGSIILGITLTGWIYMAQQVRPIMLSYANREFVFASKLLATPTHKIILGLLPYMMDVIFASLIITIPRALLADVTLSFLGIVVPNLPTLGSAMNAALSVISTFPQQLLGPIFIVTLTTMSIRLIYAGLLNSFKSVR